MTLIADNLFINKKELVPFEKGIRIDYILFKVGQSYIICLTNYTGNVYWLVPEVIKCVFMCFFQGFV